MGKGERCGQLCLLALYLDGRGKLLWMEPIVKVWIQEAARSVTTAQLCPSDAEKHCLIPQKPLFMNIILNFR